MDLTMISTAEVTHMSYFTISCITGERNAAQINLNINRENKIFMVPSSPLFKLERARTKEVVAKDFRHPVGNIGIFYCHAAQDNITMINNPSSAHVVPAHMTVTANKGETVHLSMQLLNAQERDITWKYNGESTTVRVDWGEGNYNYITHWKDFSNNTVVLTVEDVALTNQGIYSANYIGESPLMGSWMRLIIRDCPSKKWGDDCNQDCPECLNGGVCHDRDGDCICPPGFMGTRCETACRVGMFGRSCQESCESRKDCRGLRFCLLDPYGCSCASGWSGIRCDTHRAPQILDMASTIEWNLKSNPRIFCSATGNPPPSHKSIELRNYNYITHWKDFSNNTVVLTVEDVALTNQGIYSANYIGESPLMGSWMRLIIRDCPSKKWGDDCNQVCPECLNGGVCHDRDGDCICPPGFMGTRCETDRAPQILDMASTIEWNLKSNPRIFCSATGNPPPSHKSIELRKLDSTVLTASQTTMDSDKSTAQFEIPLLKAEHGGILDMASTIEWNLKSNPRIFCSATGNPPPSHKSIELRKLDSTVLTASQTTMDSDKSTAQFEIPLLKAEHGGV
ncbi:hypothetical protein CRUP_010221 [Coryphaenoides rupestris]|nr:hypothetical protein CRUP_010221 [Coryphaenoides rupestris]